MTSSRLRGRSFPVTRRQRAAISERLERFGVGVPVSSGMSLQSEVAREAHGFDGHARGRKAPREVGMKQFS